MATQLLVWYQHNGFSGSVEGNDHAIDALKELVVPNTQVKSIIVYERVEDTPPLRVVERLNYTALKELRRA